MSYYKNYPSENSSRSPSRLNNEDAFGSNPRNDRTFTNHSNLEYSAKKINFSDSDMSNLSGHPSQRNQTKPSQISTQWHPRKNTYVLGPAPPPFCSASQPEYYIESQQIMNSPVFAEHNYELAFNHGSVFDRQETPSKRPLSRAETFGQYLEDLPIKSPTNNHNFSFSSAHNTTSPKRTGKEAISQPSSSSLASKIKEHLNWTRLILFVDSSLLFFVHRLSLFVPLLLLVSHMLNVRPKQIVVTIVYNVFRIGLLSWGYLIPHSLSPVNHGYNSAYGAIQSYILESLHIFIQWFVFIWLVLGAVIFSYDLYVQKYSRSSQSELNRFSKGTNSYQTQGDGQPMDFSHHEFYSHMQTGNGNYQN